jgi:hypothetical protein
MGMYREDRPDWLTKDQEQNVFAGRGKARNAYSGEKEELILPASRVSRQGFPQYNDPGQVVVSA